MADKQHFKKERTLVLIKPDGVQRSLVGEVMGRFERMGLKFVALKMLVTNAEHVEKHYTLDPEWRRITGEKTIEGYRKKGIEPPSEDPLEITDTILKGLVNYMTKGPIVAMVLEGAHVVQIVRKLVGGTEPLTSDVGTIRGDFVLDSYQMSDSDGRAVRNIVHASGSPEEAENEIKHWFSEEEVLSYNHIQEKILYDADLDGILD